MRRWWFRRRVLWAGVILGLVLLFLVTSVLRLYLWCGRMLTGVRAISRVARLPIRPAWRSGVTGRSRTAMFSKTSLVAPVMAALALTAAASPGAAPDRPEEGALRSTPTRLGSAAPRPEEGALRSTPTAAADAGPQVFTPRADYGADRRVVAAQRLALAPTLKASEGTGSSDTDWSQIGIAFGLGALLATAVVVAVRVKPGPVGPATR